MSYYEWVGFSGKAGAGKDTAAEILVKGYGFTRVAFADALKEMAMAIDPMVRVTQSRHVDHPYPGRLSSTVIAGGWDWAKNAEPEVRGFLQRLGVAVRDTVGPDIWVSIAVDKALHIDGPVVFTDVRFPNEVDAITRHHGTWVHLERQQAHNLGELSSHVSESALDGLTSDITLANTGTRDQFQCKVVSALIRRGIIADV